MSTDSPGLVVPPPLVYLPAILLGFLTDYFWPVALLPSVVQFTVGGAIVVGSVAVVPLILREFSRAQTHFDARRPVNALITRGPFRFSRNPSYVALTLLCVGIAIMSDTLLILPWLVPAVLFVDYKIIRREEQFLEQRFGLEYLDYKTRVRRWI